MHITVKHVVTTLLLLFVIVSISYAVFRELYPRTTTNTSSSKEAVLPTKIVVYYFHTTARCASCRTIEQYSHDVIASKFKNELDNKFIEWQVTNIDEASNKHFIQDYQLKSMSLVLVKNDSHGQIAWKNLEDVWQLLDDKQAFYSYVESELLQMIGNKND